MTGAVNSSVMAFRSQCSDSSFAIVEHDITSLSANILICKMGIMLTTSQGCWEK